MLRFLRRLAESISERPVLSTGSLIVSAVASGIIVTVFTFNFFAEIADRNDTILHGGLDVSVSVGLAEDDTVEATVTVATAGGEVLAAPRLTFKKGELGKASSQTPTGETVHVLVEVDENSFTSRVELVRDGAIVARQKTVIQLPGPRSGLAQGEPNA